MMQDILEHLGEYGPSAPTIRPLRIVGFDTEDDSRGTPISFAFHTGDDTFYTRDADEALDYIYNSRETTVFCAHNLEYDIGNLMKGVDFKYVDQMVYASKLLTATLHSSKNYFLNSASFFQGSLKSLGKLVGLPKLEGDPFSEEYNLRDAEIVQVFMARMQDRLHAMGVNLGVSIGQLAMSVFRKNFMPAKITTFNHPDVLRAYYGGRVEVFYKGILKGPVHVADINSSYPDVMRNRVYPDTARLEPSRFGTHEWGYGKFTVHIPKSCFIPPLPYRSEAGRLFFPVGNVTGHWTYAEVRKALQMGCKILAEEPGVGTNHGARPYEKFIDFLYDQREIVKHRLAKNPKDADANFESLFLKLIMNNRYGKDAQHKPSTLMTRFRLSKSKLEDLQTYTEVKVGPFYGYTIERKTPPRTANYLWGIYTTAYARLSLLEKMEAVHASGSQLAYCDTDSIMFTGDAGLGVLDIGSGLGKMGVETYDLGVFRQAKGYLLCSAVPSCDLKTRKEVLEHEIEKVACKGVPTQYALEFLQEGMVQALKPMRLKEALIRTHARKNRGKDAAFFKDVGVNVWREVPKTMKGIYIKRSGDKGVTKPVDVAIIPILEAAADIDEKSMPELREFALRKQVRGGQQFRNVVVPPGWHRRTRPPAELEDYFASQKVQFLKREQLLGLAAGDTWFAGKILREEGGKFGKFYVLRLTKFMNSSVKAKNMLAALPLNIVPFFGKINFGDSVEIILAREYISGRDAEFSVRIGK